MVARRGGLRRKSGRDYLLSTIVYGSQNFFFHATYLGQSIQVVVAKGVIVVVFVTLVAGVDICSEVFGGAENS